jgi:nitrogen fixation/metabolism regulation signal transduction histidine kinase
MKEINIGKINEEIIWNRKDEIGELVNEYNKMVKKLDISAAMLARSEREGAWREMARQVAHEIKNPLTPMKLNLQYLQMAIDTNSPNVKDISVDIGRTNRSPFTNCYRFCAICQYRKNKEPGF